MVTGSCSSLIPVCSILITGCSPQAMADMNAMVSQGGNQMGGGMNIPAGIGSSMGGNMGSNMGMAYNMGSSMASNMGGMGSVNGMGMNNVMPGTSRDLQLNVMEIPFYQNLFSMADTQGMGFVDGASAAAFLQKSGLPRATLHEIWRLADVNNLGQLNFEGFAVACRLVAHVQNGLPIGPEAPSIEPPSLPIFDVMKKPFMDEAGGMGMTPGMNAGGGQLGSFMEPNMAAAAMIGGNLSSTGTPLMMNPNAGLFASAGSTGIVDTSNVWLLSETDRQKYIGVFQATDSNADGFVEGLEAKDLFSKSGVPDNELMHIWSLSDCDGDGRLNVNEFAVAMHLVGRRKLGFSLPNGLPLELANIINTGLLHSGVPQQQDAGDEFASTQRQQGATADQWGSFPTAADAAGTSGFGDDFSSEAVGIDTKRDKDKKKGKKKEKGLKETKDTKEAKSKDESDDKQRINEPSFGDLVRDEQEKQKNKFADKEDLDSDNWRSAQKRNLTKIDSGLKTERGNNVNWGDSPATLIESVIEADKKISKALAEDVDRHDTDIRRLNEISAALKYEIVREKSELDRQLERKRDFERQAEDVRLELEKIKEQRRKVDLDRISLNRDINHYQEEILFLKTQVEDMKKDIEVINESNQMTEKTYQQTEGQVKSLDIARRNVLESLKEEKNLLRTEEKEIEHLKNSLERMRREKADTQSKQNVLQEKLRQTDQDRMLLVSSLESERSKLGDLRTQRLDTCREKQHLMDQINSVAQQDWMQSRVPKATAQFQSQRCNEASCALKKFGSETSGGRTQALLRDSKGIPSGSTSATSGGFPGSGIISIEGSNIPFLQSSAAPSHWTMFGSTDNARDVERRGIDGILSFSHDPVDGSGGGFGVKKDDYIGSRASDILFGSNRRGASDDIFLGNDADEGGGGKGARRSNKSFDETDDYCGSTGIGRKDISEDDNEASGKNGNRKHSSRSSSRGKKSPDKKKDWDLEVRFSDSLDLNNDNGDGRKPKRGTDLRDVHSLGLETPSFGARSLNTSNSLTS